MMECAICIRTFLCFRRIGMLTGVLLITYALFACKANDTEPISAAPSKRTVIVYMSANNNLISEAYQNLNKIEEGFKDIDGKLIVYARLVNTAPALYEIEHDTSPFITSRRIKTYPEHDSTNPEVMRQIFEEIQLLYPAESYGAVLWSHATSWLPAGYNSLRLRSFGDDAGRSMDIADLAKALPSNLDYLIFDACSMASVEVLYELKDKASYILASPTEVVAEGMPYDLLLSDLFQEDLETGLSNVAAHFYKYYNQKEDIYRSAAISLIKTQFLSDLADYTQRLIRTHPAPHPDFRIRELQRLDFLNGSPTTSFDYLDFLTKNFASSEALSGVSTLMDKLVVYRAHTPNFNNRPIHTFSGVSCYVPGMLQRESVAQDYYKTLSWYEASGFSHLF